MRTDLDRELGLDSLARAEMLVRLEPRFATVVDESDVFEASTPADLVPALRNVERTWNAPAPADDSAGAAVSAREAAPGAGVGAASVVIPRGTRTRVEVLLHHARPCPRAHASDSGAMIGRQTRSTIARSIPVPIYPPMRRARLKDLFRRQAGILHKPG